MMVETILESSQDFGMSNGALPQWKRELLQRRAARARPPAPPAPPAPPPPPPADDDEELRYGPGIVKRLKSRYLSLALREAPRRRPSVLRRAASLEHLLDERPPPAPRPHARPARPASLAAPTYAALSAPPPRRDLVKRARSVDALSRLDSRDDAPPHVPLQPPPQPPPPPPSQPPPPPPSPPPPLPRTARPPRRPTPLLRETERPPADVVRSTLRKFESAPTRRTAPAARVSAVLRGLEALPRSSTPEPRGRSPSPAAADLSAIDEPEGAVASTPCETKQVSQAALEGIARAGSTVRYSFEAPKRGSHLPPVSATNPVLLGRSRLSASPRRVGVIRPMPAPTLDRSVSSPTPALDDTDEKDDVQRITSPLPYENDISTKKDPPPSALVEPIIRLTPEESDPIVPQVNGNSVAQIIRELTPEPETKPPTPATVDTPKITPAKPLMNGHATPPKPVDVKVKGSLSKIGAAGIERAWTGADEKKTSVPVKDKKENGETKSVVAPWARGGGAAVVGSPGAGSPASGRKPRPPAPASTSVVFNFSNRKEVPDYIENDGIILRANRRNKFKPGEAGIVVLRPEALAPDEEEDEEDARPPSPCSVRFVNDNVLINGKSSLAIRLCRERAAKLKLQFDDSLTRTFEYPSETSLCEDSPSPTANANTTANTPTPTDSNANNNANNTNNNGDAPQQLAQPAHLAPLVANTHIVSASLSRYTPSKTLADSFQLGLTRRPDRPADAERTEVDGEVREAGEEREAEAEPDAGPAPEPELELGDARPCAAESARSWSEARTHATDLLF